MPAKLNTAIQIPSDGVPDYDEVLITNTFTPVHFYGNGNIEIGDIIKADENGDYIKSEKYAVHYALLNAGVVVYKGVIELKGDELVTAMTRRPNARTEIKDTAYDILKDKNIVPNNADIT